MTLTYLMVPLINAFIGWVSIWLLYKCLFFPHPPKKIFGFTLQGIIWARLPEIQSALQQYTANEIINMGDIEQKITNPKHMDSIMPMAEEQIDHFLRNKLKEVFPMIGMFIGDKTIDQLKEVFMAELKILFPAALKMYVDGMKRNINVTEMVNGKINQTLVSKIIPAAAVYTWPPLRKIAFIAAFFGFVIGLAEIYLLNFLIH